MHILVVSFHSLHFIDCILIATFSFVTQDLALAQKDVPTFGLLSRLELHNVTGEILLTFLQKSPFLKTLILQVSNCNEVQPKLNRL